ncbi:hypothetical protein WKR98_23175 [Pigmentiphaga sp. YJ18]|uniref:hypothetical protein n=1 Tax=Pigmentiphaga sp. YJ18 TaxID=3134907 RepID=UPI0031178DB7
MTPRRRDERLSGQTNVAQKVYGIVPIRDCFTVGELAHALKTQTGAGLDIRTLRGCLRMLADAGLVREPVPGSFRRAEIKEKEKTDMPRSASIAPAAAPVAPAASAAPTALDPIDILAGFATRLRGLRKDFDRLADDIDAAALSMGEHGQATAAELERFRQLKALLKDVG